MKQVPQIVIIADDLTGAADAAGSVAARGLVTTLPLRSDAPMSCDALVFTTDSRELSQNEAFERVAGTVSNLDEQGILNGSPLIYKKLDSTFRGHPAAELTALCRGGHIDRALVAPAFPAQGRTTLDSRQLVDGKPLEKSEFGPEVTSSDLRVVFGTRQPDFFSLSLEQVRGPVSRLEDLMNRLERGLLLADAETDDDLLRLARAGRDRFQLYCGSAGLMSALMKATAWTSHLRPPSLPAARVGPGIVVAGSLHPHTRRQIDHLRTEGALVQKIAFRETQGETAQFKAEVQCACQALERGQDCVLATELNEEQSPTPEAARWLARVCLEIVLLRKPGFMILTGGETARAVFDELGISALLILGEVLPGIPHGRISGGRLDGLPFATKAGGFGDPAALHAALRFLGSTRPSRSARPPSK